VIATHELTELLEREGVAFELLPHRRTETAGDEAAALAVDPAEVAKTIVLSTGRRRVRAVLPASERLDVHKLRDLLGLAETPRLVSEEELAGAYPLFEVGAVPPVGGPAGDRVVVDRRLAERDTVVIEAGSHSDSIRLRTTDLLVLAQAEIGDLCRSC